MVLQTRTRVGTVEAARWPDDLGNVRYLVQEYFEWVRNSGQVDPDEEEALREELAGLDRYYAPPDGRFFLARLDGEPAGTAAIHRLPDEGVYELKRLYVRPSARGARLGDGLLEAAMAAAREFGATTMRLETLPWFMPQAAALYDRFGFREIPPYSIHADGIIGRERSLLE